MVAISSDRMHPHRLAILVPLLVAIGTATGAFLFATAPQYLVIALAAATAPLALVVAYRYPGAIFAAYLCTPFYKAGLQTYVPIDVTVVLAVLNILQVPFMLASMNSSEEQPPRRGTSVRSAIVLWMAFTGVMVLGVTYAPDPGAATSATITWIILTFLPSFAALRVAREQRFMEQFLWSLVLIGGIVVAAGLWLLPQVGDWPNDRLRVFGAHTIRVGQAALLVPLVALPFGWRASNPLVRVLVMLAIPPALLVAASSGSRGPLLMLGLTGLVFSLRRMIVSAGKRRGQPATIRPLRYLVPGIVLMLLLTFVPITALGSLVPETSVDRLATLTTILDSVGGNDLATEAPDNSTADRVIAYAVAEEMFVERPLLGHGSLSFASLLPYYEPLLAWPESVAHPHNLALQVAAEYGVVGLLTLAIMIAVAFRRGFRLANSPVWTTVFLLAYFFLLCAMVSTEMRDNRMLWGLLVLLLLAPEPEPHPPMQRSTPESPAPSAPA